MNTIHSFICKELNGSKFYNLRLISLFICLYMVKWLRVLLYITNNSMKHQLFVYIQLNDQTVLFLTIQFNLSHLFALSLNLKSSTRLIDRTLSGSTTLGQSGPGSNSNEGVLHIPQWSSITGALPLNCLMSYLRHLLEKFYSSAEMWSVYSIAPGG